MKIRNIFLNTHLQLIYNKTIIKIHKGIKQILSFHNKIYRRRQLNKMTLKKDQIQVAIRFIMRKAYLMKGNIY